MEKYIATDLQSPLTGDSVKYHMNLTVGLGTDI
jgi:hypothetical protein